MILSVHKKASGFSLKLFFSILITILFSNCVTVSPAEQSANNLTQVDSNPNNINSKNDLVTESYTQNTSFEWIKISEGIFHCSFFDEASHSICNAVKINLQTPNISLISSKPVEQLDDGTYVFEAETTKHFAKKNKAIIAVNSTPFNYPSGRLSDQRTLAGIYAVNDKIYAPKAGRYSALIFTADNNEKLSASIIDSQNEFETDASSRFAFGGFWTLIRNSQIISFDSKQKEPRSAAGLCDNGKTLFIISIDKTGITSKGATFNETSSILKRLGAQDGIMLDGGSSSSLIINGKQISKTFPHVEVALSFGFVIKDED